MLISFTNPETIKTINMIDKLYRAFHGDGWGIIYSTRSSGNARRNSTSVKSLWSFLFTSKDWGTQVGRWRILLAPLSKIWQEQSTFSTRRLKQHEWQNKMSSAYRRSEGSDDKGDGRAMVKFLPTPPLQPVNLKRLSKRKRRPRLRRWRRRLSRIFCATCGRNVY